MMERDDMAPEGRDVRSGSCEGVWDLSDDDAAVLDMVASAGFDPMVIARAIESGYWEMETGEERPLDVTERARLEALVSLLGLLDVESDDATVHDDDGLLVAATMARIDRYERSLKIEPEDEIARPRRRIRIPDFISVAAVLLILAGVAIPVLQRVRVSSMDMACADNLRRSATGFTLYAGDFGGRVPTLVAGASRLFPDGYEGVNLSLLGQYGYCEFGHLGCPGHHDHVNPSQRMYGHQMLASGQQLSWTAPKRVTVVIGDRSPLIEAFRKGLEIAPEAMSNSHGGRGQNMLQTDGSVLWLRLPVLGREDNVWLPHGMMRLTPGAQPASFDDAFIVD